MARVVLLVTSPRLPVGLLTAAAWDLVRRHPVLTATDDDSMAALRAAGVNITVLAPDAGLVLAALAEHQTVVWWAAPDGDQSLARDLGLRLTREPGLAELEVMYGSWDPSGARLLDVVTVMDHLVSPGGDPWKREQTHQSLARFLLEEAYEAYDAIAEHDLEALREELGDVLLQVVLHARMAQEAEPPLIPWTIDDLAGGLVEKLVRRNPHVYAGVAVTGVDEIVDNWEQIKRQEKARNSALDGIALAAPALALAAKVLSRARRAGITVPLPATPIRVVADGADGTDVDPVLGALSGANEAQLGALLLSLVAASVAAGLDPEAALRRATLSYADQIRVAERSSGTEAP